MRVSANSHPVHNAEVSSAKHTRKTAAPEHDIKKKEVAHTTVPGSVKTDISSKGKEFAKAKAIAGHAPDIREEKIAELKKRISAGKYNVDAEALAERLVDEHLKMSGIG